MDLKHRWYILRIQLDVSLHKFEIQVDAKELGIEPFIVNINRTRES